MTTGEMMFAYAMPLRTTADRTETRQAVATALGVEPSGDILALGALEARIGPSTYEPTAELYEEVLGAPATTAVVWAVDGKAESPAYGEARIRMASALIEVSTVLDAETCVLYEFERLVMRRKAGELLLYSWFPEWSEPQIRAQLPKPWAMTDDTGLV